MYKKVPECILKSNCEKQASGSVLLKKKVPLKISKNHMKATVFEYLFNKVGAATLFERCSSTGVFM